MRVLMLTPEGEADYARRLTNGLQRLPDMEIETVPLLAGRQPKAYYLNLGERLNAPDADVLHILYRHEFWGSTEPSANGYWELRYLLKKPLVLTAHDLPTLEEIFARQQAGAWKRWQQQIWKRSRTYRDSLEIAPFVTALTIVHQPEAREVLLSRGAKPSYVVVIPDSASPLRFQATRNVYRRAIEIYREGHSPDE